MNGADIIQVYEDILVQTAQMLDAARAGDWEKLMERERECRQRIESLMHAQSDAALEPPCQQRKIEILRKVLSDDAQIRALVEPRMTQLQELIAGSRQQQKLMAAYDPGPSG